MKIDSNLIYWQLFFMNTHILTNNDASRIEWLLHDTCKKFQKDGKTAKFIHYSEYIRNP